MSTTRRLFGITIRTLVDELVESAQGEALIRRIPATMARELEGGSE